MEKEGFQRKMRGNSGKKNIFENMPTYSTFIIEKREQLKDSITAQSTKNCGSLLQESAEIFGHLFEQEGLKCNDNKETLNRYLNKSETISEPVFNAILCCLFDACLSENKQHVIKHNIDDFIKFYDAVKVPNDILSPKKLKRYNSVIRRMLDKSPHLSGLGLQMKANWKIIPETDSAPLPVPKEESKKDAKTKILKGILITIILATIIGVGVWLWGLNSINASLNKEDHAKFTELQKCIFTPNKGKHQILVLPFKNIKDDTKRFDIGYVIAKRLDSLNIADSLNLEIKYCKAIDIVSDDKAYYKNIKKEYNADHVIYGFADSDCNTKNKVCVNYIASFDDREPLNYQNTNNSYGNFIDFNLEAINTGQLQENLEYAIYYNALLPLIQSRNFDRASAYIDKLLLHDLDTFDLSTLIQLQGLMCLEQQQDDLAILKSKLSLSIFPNHPSSQSVLGYSYAYNRMYEQSEKYMFEALSQNIIIVTDWILCWYYSSKQNGTHKARATYLKKLVNDLKNNPLHKMPKQNIEAFMYLTAFSMKEANDTIGYKNMLKEIERYTGALDISKGTQIERDINRKFTGLAKDRRIDRLKWFIYYHDQNNLDKANIYLRQIKTFDKQYFANPEYVKSFVDLANNNTKFGGGPAMHYYYSKMNTIELLIDLEKETQ